MKRKEYNMYSLPGYFCRINKRLNAPLSNPEADLIS